MSDVDWPLAISLGVVFVVMSVVRWRYFRSRARRWNRTAPAAPSTSAGAGERESAAPGDHPAE